jgi:hypothetical protein
MDDDVVDLILADHRLFEKLLRDLRDVGADRDAARRTLAGVLVAHAEAEEKCVYPTLRKRSSVEGDEVEHSEEEHAEGHEALLKLLEVEEIKSDDFDEAVEELSEKLNHHIAEEELTILNPARTEVEYSIRADLGIQFANERTHQLDSGCGDVANVRRLVEAARKDGQL